MDAERTAAVNEVARISGKCKAKSDEPGAASSGARAQAEKHPHFVARVGGRRKPSTLKLFYKTLAAEGVAGKPLSVQAFKAARKDAEALSAAAAGSMDAVIKFAPCGLVRMLVVVQIPIRRSASSRVRSVVLQIMG